MKNSKSDIYFRFKVLRELEQIQNSSQTAFTCSKLAIETLPEQGVKYVQS